MAGSSLSWSTGPAADIADSCETMYRSPDGKG